MNLKKFKEIYSGIFLNLVKDNDNCINTWHYFQNNWDLSDFVQNEYANELQKIFEVKGMHISKTLEQNCDQPDQVWDQFCKDRDVLVEVLNHVATVKLIDLIRITQDDWDNMLQYTAWNNHSSFEYWLKLTANRTFAKLIQDLGLMENDVLDILPTKKVYYKDWIIDNAPSDVLDHFINIDMQIDLKANEHLKYVEELRLISSYEKMGIPIYQYVSDYHGCDPDLSKILPLLSLHQTWAKRTNLLLEQNGIEASLVNIASKEYLSWLKDNDYISSPGARISYASKKLNDTGQNNG